MNPVDGPVFVDASAWVAVVERADKNHAAAVRHWRELLGSGRQLLTTNLVLAETHVWLRRRSGFQTAMRFLRSVRETRRLRVVYARADLDLAAETILVRYSDHDFSLADGVSFAVMRELGVAEAFGFDRHFRTAGFSLRPLL